MQGWRRGEQTTLQHKLAAVPHHINACNAMRRGMHDHTKQEGGRTAPHNGMQDWHCSISRRLCRRTPTNAMLMPMRRTHDNARQAGGCAARHQLRHYQAMRDFPTNDVARQKSKQTNRKTPDHVLCRMDRAKDSSMVSCRFFLPGSGHGSPSCT